MPGLNRGLGGGIFLSTPFLTTWPGRLGRSSRIIGAPILRRERKGLGMVLATILAAVFMYLWCATFSDRLSAIAGAVVFVTLPYFLSIDLYIRVAVGELWALALLPLSFFFIERVSAGSRRALLGIAVAFALVIMSHLFTAVLAAPVLLVYAVWRAAPGRRVISTVQTIAGFALAAGLAGVYTLPVLFHRRFMHPLNLISAYGANYSPFSQMFSYNALTFPQFSPGLRSLGIVARSSPQRSPDSSG